MMNEYIDRFGKAGVLIEEPEIFVISAEKSSDFDYFNAHLIIRQKLLLQNQNTENDPVDNCIMKIKL